MGRFSRIRQRHPSVVGPEPEAIVPEVPPQARKRGRPRGSGQPKPVRVTLPTVLGIRQADFPKVSPAMWNVLVSLLRSLFLGRLGLRVSRIARYDPLVRFLEPLSWSVCSYF